MYGQEALLPIEVEIPSSLKARLEPKERWEGRLLDLHKLEATREEAVNHYINQAEKRRQKFNELLKDKDLKEGALVLRYDSRLDHRQDKKFLPRWEGPFIIYRKYKNGSYHLQDLSGKLHKTRANGWRLKPYLIRMGDTPSPTLVEANYINHMKEPPDMGEFTLSLSNIFTTLFTLEA